MSERLRVTEAIVVEGKYDKIKLSALVDGIIIETNGFGIFKDKKRLNMIRALAEKRGLLILTDGDGAGFLIRGKLCSSIDPAYIKNAYIPDILGKERRKKTPSKEGKLGVEGMELDLLRQALERAGIVPKNSAGEPSITPVDFYVLGFSGGEGSAEKRKKLAFALGFPERISSKGLLQAVNGMMGREEFLAFAEKL